MPSYDPNANRPKLVPMDESAPVDAILGPAAEPGSEPVEPTAPAPAARPLLSVVPPSTDVETGAGAARVASTPAGSRNTARTALVVGVTAATVLGLFVAWRRR